MHTIANGGGGVTKQNCKLSIKKVTGCKNTKAKITQKKPLEYRKYYQDKYQLTLCVHTSYILCR